MILYHLGCFRLKERETLVWTSLNNKRIGYLVEQGAHRRASSWTNMSGLLLYLFAVLPQACGRQQFKVPHVDITMSNKRKGTIFFLFFKESFSRSLLTDLPHDSWASIGPNTVAHSRHGTTMFILDIRIYPES